MVLIGSIQGSHDKELLQIFYRSLQFVYKLKNKHSDFLIFHRSNFGGTEVIKRHDRVRVIASSNPSQVPPLLMHVRK